MIVCYKHPSVSQLINEAASIPVSPALSSKSTDSDKVCDEATKDLEESLKQVSIAETFTMH